MDCCSTLATLSGGTWSAWVDQIVLIDMKLKWRIQEGKNNPTIQSKHIVHLASCYCSSTHTMLLYIEHSETQCEGAELVDECSDKSLRPSCLLLPPPLMELLLPSAVVSAGNRALHAAAPSPCRHRCLRQAARVAADCFTSRRRYVSCRRSQGTRREKHLTFTQIIADVEHLYRWHPSVPKPP